MNAKEFFDTKINLLPYLKSSSDSRDLTLSLDEFQDHRFYSILEVYHTPEGKINPDITDRLYEWAGLDYCERFANFSKEAYQKANGVHENFFVLIEKVRKNQIKRLSVLRKEVKLPPGYIEKIVIVLNNLLQF